MDGQPKPPAPDERVGTRMGEYEIESLVGVGGMGRVYRASAGDGSAVALKLVKRDLARDETFRRRFQREARIAQTVRNPHVVPVRDTGELDGVPYLAAEFIEGVALEQKLELEGRLDLATTVSICAQVADGLQALWDAGMVHRDVKPGNILIDLSGKAYITDFGLAKDSHGSVLTRPGQPLGSIDYMPPEQIRGEPVTGAADVYSLGCVVFECVDGRPPFADREGMRVLWAHLQDEPPEPSPDRADISPRFREALKAALRKQPAERPSTSVEYARSLSEAAGIPTADATG
jgi:serine/threonine-protein kinase